MINDYINSFENTVSSILFVSFKCVVIVLTILFIFSLLMLALGCLIKSQKIKSKFLIVIPTLIIGIIILLAIPIIVVSIKNKL